MLAFISLISLSAASALAAPAALSKRDITCGTTVYNGPLALFSPSYPAGQNVSLHYQSQAEAFVITSATPGQFAFLECDSSFMGYETTTNGSTVTTYGHILPLDTPQSPNACLSTGGPTGAGSPFYIFNDECYTEDNSEQLGQFWSLTSDSVSGANVVSFIGVTANGTLIDQGENRVQWKSFALGTQTFDDEPALVYIGDSQTGATSSYSLQFV